MKKILYGICGIGMGHSFRQLPIIEELAKTNKVLIFAYGHSLKFYTSRFEKNVFVKVVEVAVPFIVGSSKGLDFRATIRDPRNNKEFHKINFAALEIATSFLGTPDLVISDYEPISASYAYATNTSLVTIDQQSKYLTNSFPKKLSGTAYLDEQMRLQYFFPSAVKRIATSFFKINSKNSEVLIRGPIIRNKVRSMKKNEKEVLLIYITSQQDISQSYESIVDACTNLLLPIHIYFPKEYLQSVPKHINIHKHHDGTFSEILEKAKGIVSTAGHTLLSEAMHLETPVYAIPLQIYEQQMNADIIKKGGFGVVENSISEKLLTSFVENIPTYKKNIQLDKQLLNKEDSLQTILKEIRALLDSSQS